MDSRDRVGLPRQCPQRQRNNEHRSHGRLSWLAVFNLLSIWGRFALCEAILARC
jgi:hypothetical protein